MPASNDLLALVNDFVARLESAIRADLVARLTENLPNGTGPAAKNPSARIRTSGTERSSCRRPRSARVASRGSILACSAASPRRRDRT